MFARHRGESGSQISGNTVAVVIVKTNAGYDANPGHAGGVFFDALRGDQLALMVGISSRRPSTRLTRQVHEPPIAVLGVF